MIQKEVLEEQFSINNVPITLFRPSQTKSQSTFLYYHGWTSSVENYRFLGKSFAAQGIKVIMPEVEEHGTRLSDQYYFNSFDNMLITMEQTYAEFADIKNQLFEQVEIDFDKFAIGGHSMGAFISAYLFLKYPEFQQAHLFNGVIDTEAIIYEIEGSLLSLSEEERKLVNNYNPAQMLAKLGQRKMYCYNGLQDTVVSPVFMQKFQTQISTNGQYSNEFIFNFYENAGHDLTYKMLRDCYKAILS